MTVGTVKYNFPSRLANLCNMITDDSSPQHCHNPLVPSTLNEYATGLTRVFISLMGNWIEAVKNTRQPNVIIELSSNSPQFQGCTVLLWLVISPVASQISGFLGTGTFLWRVWMFFLCLCGFLRGVLVFSHSPKTRRLCQMTTLNCPELWMWVWTLVCLCVSSGLNRTRLGSCVVARLSWLTRLNPPHPRVGADIGWWLPSLSVFG